MPRDIVTAKELKNLINEKLHSEIGNENFDVGVPQLLREPDAEGCNWSCGTLSSHGVSSNNIFIDDVNEVIQWARQRYNIKTE